MNVDFELYRIFYYVSKNKNITKASEELFISQPAVTQQIKKLEDILNLKLFYRSKKGVELTEDGETLFNSIKDAVETLNLSKEIFNSENVIRIGSGNAVLKYNVSKYIIEFNKKFPNVKFEIFHERTDKLFELLKNNQIDLVFYKISIVEEGIISIEIDEIEDSFIASPKYLNKNLKEIPFILQSTSASSRKFLDKVCLKNKINLTPKYELESYDIVLEFVKLGLGVGFINKDHVKSELASGELVEIDLDFEIPRRTLNVAVNKKKQYNKYIKEFVEIIKN